jgi:hypothetical protein
LWGRPGEAIVRIGAPGAALLAEPIRQHPANPRYFLFRATTSTPSPAME